MLFILFLAYFSQTTAQESDEKGETPSVLDKASSGDNSFPSGGGLEQNNDIEMIVWCADIDNQITQKICWEASQARFRYYQKGLDHRTDVFRWQHISTKIIFVVVLMLVFMGLYFAWVQFQRDISNSKDTNNQVGEHTVELSASGIKVSSPVLGVIILTLSLAFFYLYLVFVYPITEVF